MVFLILFVASVATICMVTVWSRPTAKDPAPPESAGPRAAAPESLEGVLVAKLLAGEISTAQYRHAIEGLAARDDDRHPLSVPPDPGSAEA